MVFRRGYFLVSRTGTDCLPWVDVLEDGGVDTTTENPPLYWDPKPRKPRGGPVTIEAMPELMKALGELGRGECLTIPHFGHLASAEVWLAVADELVIKGATLESLWDEAVLDGTDIRAGLNLLKRHSGRGLADPRGRARVKMGRPRKTLSDAELKEALRLFPDPDWSTDRLAKHFGLGRMTFLRRIEEATGTMSKGEALELREAGNWPSKEKPNKKRKRRPERCEGKM